MESAGTLIREGRARLGLSTRDLARLTGVAYPTISRIEQGHEDPRWSTMTKLLVALTPDPDAIGLAEMSDAYTLMRDGEVYPDFTRFRAFVDFLHRHPYRTACVILPPPPTSGVALVDNLLAATAEKLADDVGIRRPLWTRQVASLAEPWYGPGTPRMRARNARGAPAQFAARGLMIPVSTLWRARRSPRELEQALVR